MTDMGKLIRAGLFLALMLLFGLMAYFFWYASQRNTTPAGRDEPGEAGDDSTAVGLGVTQLIDPGRLVNGNTSTPDQSGSPPPEPEAETPTEQPVSSRTALYEEAELDLLQRELEAGNDDVMERRELRKQAMRSPIGASRFSFEALEAGGQTNRTGQSGPDPTGTSALPAPAPSLVLPRPSGISEPQASEEEPGPDGPQVAAADGIVGPAGTALADIGYSPHRTVPARSPYELRKGTVIPGILATGINSDIPGFISGTVRLDVFDTVTGRHLLIPAGSRVFGRYDADTAYGQNRLEVVWTHLMFPNGDAIVLDGQQATDGAGQSGFSDRRKGNFLRILGGNLLFSIIGAGEQAAQARIERAITGGPPEGDDLADALGELGSGLSGRGGDTSAAGNFNRQQSQLKPTLLIRPGYPFNILVARDLILEPRR